MMTDTKPEPTGEVKITHIKEQLGSGNWVIKIKGTAGGVSLNALSFPDNKKEV